LWSSGTIRFFPFATRPNDIQQRFTSIALPFWSFGNDYEITYATVKAFIAENSFPISWTLQGWSNYSAGNVRDALIAKGSPEVWDTVRLGHPTTSTGDRLNFWNGSVLELIIKATCHDVAHLLAKNPTTYGILPASEYRFAGMPGDIADAVAAANGITNLELWPPVVGTEGTPFQKILDDSDATYQSLLWHYSEATKYQYQHYVREILGNAIPDFSSTEDLQVTVYDTLTTDRFHNWVLTDAPNIPLLVSYFAELAVAKDRYQGTSTTVVIGPQLATRTKVGDTTYYRPTSVDMYATYAWLSLTSGIARGLVGWGLPGLINNDGTFRDNAEVLWDYLAAMRAEITSDYNDLIMAWTAAPRRTAVLYSTVDKDLYCSGWNYQPVSGITPCTRRWQSLYSTQNAYYATRWAGEPCDLVLDVDSLDGYEVLVIGCLHVHRGEVIKNIARFMARGGTVIVHDGSVLETAEAANLGIDASKLKVLDGDYGAHAACPSSLGYYFASYGSGTYEGYYTFLAKLAEDIDSKLPGGAAYRDAPSGVIVNRLMAGDREYIALVNCNFEYGAEEAWLRSIGGRAGKFCEVGQEVVFNNCFGAKLKDQVTRGVTLIDRPITVKRGDHRVFEVLPDRIDITQDLVLEAIVGRLRSELGLNERTCWETAFPQDVILPESGDFFVVVSPDSGDFTQGEQQIGNVSEQWDIRVAVYSRVQLDSADRESEAFRAADRGLFQSLAKVLKTLVGHDLEYNEDHFLRQLLFAKSLGRCESFGPTAKGLLMRTSALLGVNFDLELE